MGSGQHPGIGCIMIARREQLAFRGTPMPTRTGLVLFLLSLVILLGPVTNGAQSRGQVLSPQQRQAILDYHLTLPGAEHLIEAMQAMTKYLVSLPDYQERMRKSATMTAAERIAQLESDA